MEDDLKTPGSNFSNIFVSRESRNWKSIEKIKNEKKGEETRTKEIFENFKEKLKNRQFNSFKENKVKFVKTSRSNDRAKFLDQSGNFEEKYGFLSGRKIRKPNDKEIFSTYNNIKNEVKEKEEERKRIFITSKPANSRERSLKHEDKPNKRNSIRNLFDLNTPDFLKNLNPKINVNFTTDFGIEKLKNIAENSKKVRIFI